ncbi:hypothetical protein Taro_048745 [Colocasia esculenta]|uniref:Uncharacterized protein n=1 Tax=Colocasia esculenta TaxID=4460 RepID=A0A843X8Z9_COLES|nr:hypothetical protein [Colocasia esculenta]
MYRQRAVCAVPPSPPPPPLPAPLPEVPSIAAATVGAPRRLATSCRHCRRFFLLPLFFSSPLSHF